MKSYLKSENCELVWTPVSWNIRDEEQRKDLEYILSSPSRGKRIKECIRHFRLMMANGGVLPTNAESMPTKSEIAQVNGDDILDSLV